MFAPVRSLYALAPRAHPTIIASVVAVTAMFSATPFLIPEVADRFGVSDGVAGFISVTQVGAFALTTWLVPRWSAPTARLLRMATVGLLLGNVISALTVSFAGLLAARVVAGGAAGLMTWVAWAGAMRQPRSMSAVAGAGPLAALLAAPLFGLVTAGGASGLYATLAVVTVAGLPGRPAIDAGDRRKTVSASRSNRILLGALALLTMSGASLFVYEAVAADVLHGLSPVAASWAFSLNAGAGFAGARLASRHRHPGWWLASAGPAAALTVLGGHPAFFYAGMAWWGFAFWMGLPGVLQMLSERSLEPGERAGDAQSLLAVGRAIGPFAGGGFVDAGALGMLGVVAGSGVAAAGAAVAAVRAGRDRRAAAQPGRWAR